MSKNGIPMDFVKKKQAQKSTGSKLDLINHWPTFLMVVDVRA